MSDLTITQTYPLGGVDGEFDPTVTDGRRFTLSRDFQLVLPSYGYSFLVPKGFVTDFNSVPRALWVWFAPWNCVEAGVVHDWLYQHPGVASRAQCDLAHCHIMESCQYDWLKAHTVWLGIRSGGWKPWNVYRKQGLR